jgi:hypothetical protein
MMRPIHTGIITIAALVLSVFITACGGGGGGSLAGGGIGGTGVTSGTVSGFGSVFVNGIEFETDGASRDVDDEISTSNGFDDDTVLGIGMVVTITGTVNADGATGTADSIVYDDDVEGPVAAIAEAPDMVTKTLTIFDFTIVVNRNTTVFENTAYGSLAANDLLEVSGYFGADGKLYATRVEKQGKLALGVSGVELKGTVSGFDGIDSFMLGAVTVTFDGTTEFEDLPGTVTNGQFVEVEGTLETATSIAASRIELEDEGFGDDVDEISLEGIVTDFNDIGNFRVSGQRVNASSAMFEPATLKTSIADDARVEVEGSIVNGILRATEVQQRAGDVQLSAVVLSTNNMAGTLRLQVVQGQPAITVTVNNKTQIEDKLPGGDEPLDINGIVAGDFLNVEGFVDDSDKLIASQIERDEVGDIVLRGPIDKPPTGGSTASGTVSILGVSIATDNSTDFDGGDITGTEFFLQVNNGDLVEFTDYNEVGLPADGFADEVEFED